MTFLSYAYRFVSNFLFMALVYFSLNYVDKYQQRAIIAMMVLGYVVMRTVSALRSLLAARFPERTRRPRGGVPVRVAKRRAGYRSETRTPRSQKWKPTELQIA